MRRKIRSDFIARSTALRLARTKEVVELQIADGVVSGLGGDSITQQAVTHRTHYVITWTTDVLCVICRPHA